MLSSTSPPLERQSAAEVARLHHLSQARAYQQAKSAAASPCYDLQLLKPVALVPPPPQHAASERVRLESELGCLRREQAQTARAIAHLQRQLGR